MSKWDKDIVTPLLEAAEQSFLSLFREHKEDFYYCTLVMLEVGVPCISAMSQEALERIILPDENYGEAKEAYKWSYADSPYFAYAYERYWDKVSRLFEKRFNEQLWDGSASAFEAEYLCWIDSMEEVMRRLDEKGIFGRGDMRNKIFINAEISPPDYSNSERARRLNSSDICSEWLRDCAEPEFEEKKIDWEEIWRPRLCDVILTKPVTDKKIILQIKNALNINRGLAALTEDCRKTPFIILKNEPYKAVMESLDKFPLIQPFLSVKKQK